MQAAFNKTKPALLITAIALIIAGTIIINRKKQPIDRIVMISIDGLRIENLSFYGYSRETSPFLAGLAEKGTVFTTAFPGPVSDPTAAHASIFTAVHPGSGKNKGKKLRLTKGSRTIASVLSENGFQTAGISGLNTIFRDSNLTEGFSYFDEPSDITEIRVAGEYGFAEKRIKDFKIISNTGRNCTGVINSAIDWVKRRRTADRFFLLISICDLKMNPEFHKTEETEAYDSTVSLIDSQIRRLFQQFSDDGIYEKTLLVIYSPGDAAAASGKGTQGKQSYSPLIFFSSSGGLANRRVESPVELISIFPTIIDLAGIEHPDKSGSLVPMLKKTAGR
jgi:arylsulfatase A-like enzyme